jgi:hypothetical protein
MVHPGDVFTARLLDGRYIAVRVLRTEGRMSLVSTSPYLNHQRPSLDVPLIRQSVVQKRFYYKGEPARKWLEGAPPRNFEFLGTIPLCTVEAETDCNSYGGKWSESSGNEAYLEWRWLHDRAAFEEEVRQKQEAREQLRQLPQKPKKMMGEDDFWSVIALLDWKHRGQDGDVLAPAIKALASKSRADIARFQERLAYLLYQLDTRSYASNIGENSYDPASDYVSADGFLYARCAVVANGRESYRATLNDASQMLKDTEFETILGLASAAYELKTGDEFEYSTGCSYETFSNVSGWR